MDIIAVELTIFRFTFESLGETTETSGYWPRLVETDGISCLVKTSLTVCLASQRLAKIEFS